VVLFAVGLGLLVAGCRSHRADDAKSGPAFRSANRRARRSSI